MNNIKDTKLSIQFNLDGFSFCITNNETLEIVHFETCFFDKNLETPEKLVLKIEEIFKNNYYLQQDFSSVNVIHQNNLATLVPNKYFNESALTSYLELNIKTLTTDFITFDVLNNIDATNVYIPYVNVNNYLFQNFGEFEYSHHLSKLIDNLLTINTNPHTTMFVNVSKNSFDVVVLQLNELLFCNTFSFNTKEDFIYYLLFVAEQLELNTEEFPLRFTGVIETTSEIYKITFNYIKNIDFLESKNPIFNTLENSKHSNFILLGL